jgi:hypothetical protein
MTLHLEEIIRVQSTYLVPIISVLVSTRQQEWFNFKVLASMGVLNSRLYLCSMHQAIQQDPVELALFEKEIPSISQLLLPRWTRLLYHPRFTDLLRLAS